MSIRFEITRSTQLLNQYFHLRQKSFRRELGISCFDGSETPQDREGQVLVAIDNDNRVLAGARILDTGAADMAQFDLLSLFPDLQLSGKSYCHWGRLVVHPNYRSTQFNRRFLHELIEFSKAQGYHYAFLISDHNRSRYYRLLHSSLGYDFKSLQQEIDAAETSFAGLEHLVSYAVLQPENEICVQSGVPALLATPDPEMSSRKSRKTLRGNPNRLAQVA